MSEPLSPTPQLQAGGGQTASHPALTKLSTVSPSVLKYIKNIADGATPFDTAQLSEYSSFSSTRHTGVEPPKENGRLDLNELLGYMTSPESNVLQPAKVQDLSKPIASYFISSSHNTYLTGNQLFGDASTEAYRNVLLRGCRCIEIDVWDGEEKNLMDEGEGEKEKHGLRSLTSRMHRHHIDEKAPDAAPTTEGASMKMPKPWRSPSSLSRAEPRVLHGHTLTKEVSFRAVCAAIRDSAFVSSDLPIIVSLEVHTCAEQQGVMVEIMKEEWGSMLVEAPKEECEVLPSPADLRGKILVKIKAGACADSEAALAALGKVPTHSSSDSEDRALHTEAQIKKPKKKGIVQALSALGIYTQAYHFKTLSAPEAKIPTHVFSLSEKKLIEIHQSQGPSLFSHNRNFLMRAFPSGTRIGSSNLDPALFWRKGVQMVALNWQKFDAGVMLNEGMFGGTDGWVLKPIGYRGSESTNDKPVANNQADAMPHKILHLKVEMFAGQDIPLPLGDDRPERFRPYVKVELHVEKPEERAGAPIPGGGRSQDGEHKGRTKNSNGTDPDFGGEVVQFTGIMGVVEELSFVRFKIQNHSIGKDELAAWACIRLDRLRTGFRFIHCLDAKGMESRGVLLVRITKQVL